MIQFVKDPATKVISSGAVTIDTRYNYVVLDTEGGSAADDLDTINGAGLALVPLLLESLNGARVVTVKDGTGNIFMPNDQVLDSPQDKLLLMWNGSGWYQLNFANNG